MAGSALGHGLRGFAKACLADQETARKNSSPVSMTEIPSLRGPQLNVTALPDLGLLFSRAKLYCRVVSSFSIVLLQACGDGRPWESYIGGGTRVSSPSFGVYSVCPVKW